MPKTSLADQVNSLKATMTAAGLAPTAGSYRPFDANALAKLAQEIPVVHLLLHRMERVSPMSNVQRAVTLPGVKNVRVSTLILDPQGFFNALGVGGGAYTVEVMNPNMPEQGVLYGFQIQVHGAPRTPPEVQRQEAMAQQNQLTEVQTLAESLMQSGTPDVQAYMQAQDLLRQNPMAALMLRKKEKPEDDMSNMMMTMMVMQAQAEQAREAREERRREREAEFAKSKPAVDPMVETLRAELAEMKAKQARTEERQAFLEVLRPLADEVRTLKAEVSKPKTDWAELALKVAPLLGGYMNKQDQAQDKMLGFVKEQMAAAGHKRDEIDALFGNFAKMAQVQLDQRRLQMEEPLHGVKAMSEMAGMMAGLAKAFVAVQASQQGNPILDAFLGFMQALPEAAQGFLSPVETRATVGGAQTPAAPALDEQAARAEALQAADDQIAKVQAGDSPPPPAQLTAEVQVVPEVMQKAKEVLEKIAWPGLDKMLEFDGGAELVLLLPGPTGHAEVIGKKVAAFLLGMDQADALTEECLKALQEPKTFANHVAEKLGWKKRDAGLFAKGIAQVFEANVAGVAPSNGTGEEPAEPATETAPTPTA